MVQLMFLAKVGNRVEDNSIKMFLYPAPASCSNGSCTFAPLRPPGVYLACCYELEQRGMKEQRRYKALVCLAPSILISFALFFVSLDRRAISGQRRMCVRVFDERVNGTYLLQSAGHGECVLVD